MTAQDQATLTADIQAIQGLYDAYQNWVNDSPTVPCWEASSVAGNACFGQNGVETWLDEVTDPENGIQARLNGIADLMIQPANTGVISECVQTITNNYNDSKTDGPAQHVFDDYYYTQVQQLTNYYYGVQAQGATLLSEADHLQACLSLGASACVFANQPSTLTADPVAPGPGATPADPGAICDNAAQGSQAAADCKNAQSAVGNVYATLEAQLILAGAPYTNKLVAKLWAGDQVWPWSLEEFTNNATSDGQKIQSTPCPTPLTSAEPCGFTVGPYDLALPNDHVIAYGGYGGDTLWRYANAADLSALLTTYNNETSGNTRSKLSDWMDSVGFLTAQNKIVLTGTTGQNFVPLPPTTSTTTICFMDTSLDRSASKQPWCDNGAPASTSTLLQAARLSTGNVLLTAADFTGTSIDPAFYTIDVVQVTQDLSYYFEWHIYPGWTVEGEQPNEGQIEFQQFHWPTFSITSLPSDWCTVREKGTAPQDNKNPGGILTICGADLQAWLDQVLADPKVSFQVVETNSNSTLLGADRNRNDGAGTRLALRGKGGVGANVVVVAFDNDLVQRFLDRGPLGKATLILNVAKNRRHWGVAGQRVAAYPLPDAIVEGNGNVAARERGAGPGVTWNCAVDAEISDPKAACLDPWSGPRFKRFRGRHGIPALHHDGRSGQVAWDVTAQVEDGIRGWALRKTSRRHGGSVDYYSKEGARERLDDGLVPSLVLER